MPKIKKLDKLIDFLFKYFNENIIMPCIYKNPKYPHKNNQWTWNMAKKKQNEITGNVAILLKTLIILDFDNESLAEKYENKFPILKICPLVRTKKGFHYYFRRTLLCDLYALYDHSRCFGNKADEIDFKTICSTGTAGVVIIPPSKDKTWIKSLWDTEVPEFKDEIFDYFVDNWVDKKYINPIENTKDDKNNEKILDTEIGEEFFDKIDADDTQFDKIKKLVDNLDDKRSISWTSWIEVCWCLKNISAGYHDSSEIFKSIFINFSKRCPDKFNKEQCLTLWNNTVPRKSGFNYSSLCKWNRKDNPNDYVEIDQDSMAIIKKFAADSYNYGSRRITNINIVTYDSDKYFIMNIDDTFCKIVHDYHESKTIYIVVGVKSAKEKCRDCKDKFINEINYDKFPDDLKDIIQHYLITITTPEQGLKDFVDTIDDINIVPMSKEYVSSPEKVSMVGKIFDIHNNTYCPHHPQAFDDQCRCCAMVSNDGKLGITCNKFPNRYYPESGIIIPIEKLQIINNNITTNNIYNFNNENVLDNSGKIIDDNYAAKKFVELMGNNICYTEDNIWVFDDKYGLWSKDENDLNIQILKYEEELKFIAEVKETTIVHNYSGMVHKKQSMIKAIPQYCTIKNFFDHDKIASGFGKILFKDSMYDFDTNSFSDEFDNNYCLFANIPRTKPIKNEEDMSLLNKIIFIDPFIDPDMGIRLKEEIALAMHGGHYHRRQFIFGHGITSSGKGVLTNALQATFGNYIGTWHVSSMGPDNNAVDTIRYKFMCDIYRNRLNIANENSRGFMISTEKFCTIVSGGDEIKARKLYDNDNTIINYSTMMALTNDMIKFDNLNPAVPIRFPGAYEFEILFVDKPVNKFHKKKIPDLKNMIHSRKYRDALFWIIAETYQKLKNNNFILKNPINFVKNKQDMFADKTLIDIFNDNFEFTDNIKDKISSDYVFDIISPKFPGIDKKTIKIELQASGISEYSKTIKFLGGSCRGYAKYRKKFIDKPDNKLNDENID